MFDGGEGSVDVKKLLCIRNGSRSALQLKGVGIGYFEYSSS